MSVRQKFIAICTPSLGRVSLEWASNLRALMLPLNTGYCECFGIDEVGGEIAEGRNGCVARALSYESAGLEVTHLFWVDDDVLISRAALLRLWFHHRDIASGVYFTRSEYPEPLIFASRGGGTLPFVPNQTFECWGHGMGLTLVKMDVYRRMRDEMDLGVDKYGRPAWYKTPGAEDATVENGVLWYGGTEDLYFLDRAAKLGYRSLVDTHRAAFGWHFDLQTRQGYPLEQYKQFKAGKPIVWKTPDGEVVWGAKKQEASETPGAR